jgi:hypothetical protein
LPWIDNSQPSFRGVRGTLNGSAHRLSVEPNACTFIRKRLHTRSGTPFATGTRALVDNPFD